MMRNSEASRGMSDITLNEGDPKVAPFFALWIFSRFRQNFLKRCWCVIFPRPAESPHVTLEW